MDKFIKLWEPVLKSFSRAYPDYYKEMVDWFPSAHLEITVKLRDGRKIAYEFIGDYITFIKDPSQDEQDFDEQAWREKFSKNLYIKMRKMGINHYRLSELTGISTVTLSKYVNAKASPSGYNIQLLARALGCSVTELTNMR